MTSDPIREEDQLRPEGARIEYVSCLWDLPDEPTGTPILLAHGAGVPMRSEFMESMAIGLATGGHPVLRFNYPYAERMDQGASRRPPDRREPLLATHREALAALCARFPDTRPVMAGKSMGGRLASMLAVDEDKVARLLFYGYPLHPPGKPEKQRTEHFPALTQPALFLQGDRDALCDLELLKPALETYGGTPTLQVIDGADHDFGVLVKTGRTRPEVLADLVERSLDWLKG